MYDNYIKIVNQSIDDDLIDSIIHTILISEYETWFHMDLYHQLAGLLP